LQCTDKKGSGQTKLASLSTYVKASANNDPTDNSYELGPPYDTTTYPFNQIQGFWQVDASSVQVGLLHSSTLLQDNQQSQVNAEMVKMAYNGQFHRSILHGQCGIERECHVFRLKKCVRSIGLE
jgi:hypothetical protein